MDEEQDENTNTSLLTNQEDVEKARKFLGNLSDVGSLCKFEEIGNAENPILAGEIVKIEPFKSNAEVCGPKVMITTLKEAYQCGSRKRREFLVFFLNEAAEQMAQTELTTKDYLAIHRPILFRSPIFSRSPRSTFNAVLIVGSSSGNRVLDIYGKGRLMKDWFKLSRICTELRRFNTKRKRPIASPNELRKEERVTNTGEAMSTVEPVVSDGDDLISSKPKAQIGPRIFTNAKQKQPMAFPSDEQVKEKYVTNTNESTSAKESVNRVQNDILPNSLDAQGGQRTSRSNANPNSSLKDTGSAKTRAVESLLNTESVRLKDVRNGMNVTVFGVIMDQREQKLTVKNRFFSKIEISDETCKMFPVEFYLTLEEVPLTLRQFDIIKLANMEIKTYKNTLYGSIKKTRNVVTYARENPNIRYNQTQSYEYTSEDNKRVKKLIRWMQNNVPGAQMFTRLCDIKNIATNVHLLGTVVQKKFFKNSKNLVIRLRDGTQTTQYFHEYDFSKENFATSRKEIPMEGSDVVDVLVIDTTSKFRDMIEKLEVGTSIELYNVRTSPQHYTYKAKNGCAINLHFIALEKNLRIRETDSQLESQVPNETEITEFEDVNQFEYSDTGIVSKKRKLFNADELIMPIDKTNSSPCEKETAEIGRNSRAMNETTSNPCRNIETKLTEIENLQAAYTAVEIDSNPRERVISVCTSQKRTQMEKENEDELISDSLPQLQENPNTKNNESALVYSSCKVVIPCLEDFSEPNSPEQEEGEDVLSTTRVQTDLEKVLIENLYLKTTEIVKISTSIQNLNTIQNGIEFEHLKEWPHDVEDEFWIKVSLISTLPVITSMSNDMDLLSLISAHCIRCKKYTPFFFVSEWTLIDKGCITLCPSCKVNGKKVHLRHLMIADLLVQDGSGKMASAIVAGCTAERFFGCTMAELITSKEAQLRVKNFMVNSKTLILKLKIWKTTAQGINTWTPQLSLPTTCHSHTNCEELRVHFEGLACNSITIHPAQCDHANVKGSPTLTIKKFPNAYKLLHVDRHFFCDSCLNWIQIDGIRIVSGSEVGKPKNNLTKSICDTISDCI